MNFRIERSPRTAQRLTPDLVTAWIGWASPNREYPSGTRRWKRECSTRAGAAAASLPAGRGPRRLSGFLTTAFGSGSRRPASTTPCCWSSSDAAARPAATVATTARGKAGAAAPPFRAERGAMRDGEEARPGANSYGGVCASPGKTSLEESGVTCNMPCRGDRTIISEESPSASRSSQGPGSTTGTDLGAGQARSRVHPPGPSSVGGRRRQRA
jgi:hypothetical protein